jgi:hydrogenase expression/formation protein HypC
MCLAIPGEIVDVRDEHGMRFGRVRFGGITRDVCLEYEPEAGPGDFVLVHVGFAIATVDPEEAARTWETLRELGQLDEVEAPATADEGETPT